MMGVSTTTTKDGATAFQVSHAHLDKGLTIITFIV